MSITIGAIGPGEAIDLEFTPAPPGVDFTAVTRSVSVALQIANSSAGVLTSWTTIEVTEDSWLVRFVPTGTEFNRIGALEMFPDLTLGGTVYRFGTVADRVVKR